MILLSFMSRNSIIKMKANKIELTDLTKVKRKQELTVWQSIVSGGVLGFIEVMVNHPLWTIKTRMQGRRPFTLNPEKLYRGVGFAAIGKVPLISTQIGMNQFIKKNFFSDNHELSSTQRILSSFSAGVTSSIFCCPTDMTLSNIRKDEVSAIKTIARLYSQGGVRKLYTGFLATMIREGFYATFFLAITPLIKKKIEPFCESNLKAFILAGIASGIGAAIITQPADTIKTVQQRALESKNFTDTFKFIYASYGASGLFEGFLPRSMRVVSGVTLLGVMNSKVTDMLCDDSDMGSNARKE